MGRMQTSAQVSYAQNRTPFHPMSVQPLRVRMQKMGELGSSRAGQRRLTRSFPVLDALPDLTSLINCSCTLSSTRTTNDSVQQGAKALVVSHFYARPSDTIMHSNLQGASVAVCSGLLPLRAIRVMR